MRKLMLALVLVLSSLAATAGAAIVATAPASAGGTICTSSTANWYFGKNTINTPTTVWGSTPVNAATYYSSGLGTTYDVASNYWNPQSLSLTDYGCNYNSYTVTGTVNNEGGAVQAFPEDWVNMPVGPSPYNPLALTSYTSVTSKYGVKDTPTGASQDYEWAHDDFLCDINSWSGDNCTEIMDWTYTDGQIPICAPGGATQGSGCISTTETIDGVAYNVYVGNDGNSPDTVTYEQQTNTTSGTIDILGLWDDAATNGWTASGAGKSGTYAIASSFGPEICGTPSTGDSFEVTNYNLDYTHT